MYLDYLFAFFKQNQDSIILCHDKDKYTYMELENKMSYMQNLNIPNNSVVGIVGDYSINFISLLFTLYKKRCIISPILPKNLDFSLNQYGIEYLVYSDTEKIEILSSAKHKLLNYLKLNNKSGLILFSSGSTGKPKAIIHDLDKLFKLYVNKQYNNVIVINTFLPDHIAGIDVLLNVIGCGGTVVIPKDRTPNSILEAIKKHNVSIIPASPTMLRLLSMVGFGEDIANNIKLITYGSERMDSNLLRLLKKSLPYTKFKQSFGTSETGSLKTKSFNNGFFKLCSQYKILNNELYIKSDTQALGYLNADNSVFDNDGYFATGDIVETIEYNNEEYIKIIGRMKEVINVGGEKVIPQEVEGIILQIEGISDCLVYGENNAITGQSVSAKIVLDKNNILLNQDIKDKDNLTNIELKKIIRKFCKDKLATYKIPNKIELVESLQVSDRFKKVRKGY